MTPQTTIDAFNEGLEYIDEMLNDFSTVYSATPMDSCGMGTFRHSDFGILLRAGFSGTMHRGDGLSVIGILNHEVMHKILYRLENNDTCTAYDKIFYSMMIDHDYQNGVEPFINGGLDE